TLPIFRAALPPSVGKMGYSSMCRHRSVAAMRQQPGRWLVHWIGATLVAGGLVGVLCPAAFAADPAPAQSQGVQLSVTERGQLPSQMPLSYAAFLNPADPRFLLKGEDIRPDDFMTWQFYGGSLDPDKRTRENLVFFLALDPRKIRPMMDGLEDLDE